MDYTITFKTDIDTSSIDRLEDKINQLHSGNFSRGSRIGRLHRKINKTHDETQLNDYPNIKKLQNKVNRLYNNLEKQTSINLRHFIVDYKFKEPQTTDIKVAKTIQPQLFLSYNKTKNIEDIDIVPTKNSVNYATLGAVTLLVGGLSLFLLSII